MRGVDAPRVEAVRDGSTDPAHRLVAHERRDQYVRAARAHLLAHREGRGQHDRGRVDESTCVGVVEVEAVHEGAVRERRRWRRDPGGGPQRRGLGRSTQGVSNGEDRVDRTGQA